MYLYVRGTLPTSNDITVRLQRGYWNVELDHSTDASSSLHILRTHSDEFNVLPGDSRKHGIIMHAGRN